MPQHIAWATRVLRFVLMDVNDAQPNTARLLISCQDRPGIVAAVSQFLYSHGANVLNSSQHSTDPSGGTFFMRMVFYLARLRYYPPHSSSEPLPRLWRTSSR